MEEFLDYCISEEPLQLDAVNEHVFCRPKLKRFEYHDGKFRHLRFFAWGEDGYLFRFREDDGKEYCLKLFRDWKTIPTPYGHPVKNTCPFANECRAFARLNDMNCNGQWAVKCYGWMQLSDVQFAQCVKRAHFDVACMKEMRVMSDIGQLAGRLAIVKEYIPNTTTAEHIPEIIENMEIPKSADILPGDVSWRNYRGPLLVDLGGTLIEPFFSKVEFDWFYSSCDAFFDEGKWFGI